VVPPPEEGPDTVIGRYKILEKIGEGGFGVVYVAEQRAPVKRRVALKIIKLGMDTRQVVARFEAERQALALMEHPNIAKALDAGATETGRPFFVMELVKGIPITRYCDREKLGRRERLELFIQVCHAIQHAHQKGIIHRDIKPSNILVTLHDGIAVSKVIDFGIAKATQAELTEKTVYTQFHQFIGTPAYMSPEQAEMSGLDIDTRSDIYSLGVLLYELLTGSTPFDTKELLRSGLDEMRKIIREREPERPSRRITREHKHGAARSRVTRGRSAVDSDLDWIVMKCLEKDRTRRYETANALGADLTRHLADEPVLARPPSGLYHFHKSVQRNRLAYSAAGAVAGALAVGVVLSLWQAVRAVRAERLAGQRLVQSEKARAEAEAIAKFMTGVFQSPDPARDGRTITVAEALDTAAKKLERDLADQPERRAQFQSTLGLTYCTLGLLREAIPLQEKARDYHLTYSGPEHTNTLGAMHRLAAFYFLAGRRDEALKLREEVLTLRRKVNGHEHPDTLRAMNNLAISYDAAGRREEALKLREEVLTLSRKVNGPEHPDTLMALNNLPNSYDAAGRREEALKLREEVLLLRRKVNGPEHPDTLTAMDNLAISYEAAGPSGRGAEAGGAGADAPAEGQRPGAPRHAQGYEQPGQLIPLRWPPDGGAEAARGGANAQPESQRPGARRHIDGNGQLGRFIRRRRPPG
jgi:tetratricopeptide (TPR) repeat protein/tRNA A-37 threonylcarbamoyl transferase component Bud32